MFFILYIGFNIIISGFTPAFNRLMSFYEEDERAVKFGRLGMMASIGYLVGSVFASLAFTSNVSGNPIATFRAMFPIAMVISLFTFFLAFRLKETTKLKPNVSLSDSRKVFTSEKKTNLRPVFILLILIVLINISSSIYVNFFTIFVQDELNLDISFIALGNSIATLFGVFATYFVGKSAHMFKKKTFVLLATILYTIFPFSIFLFRNPIFIFILYCLPFYAILFVIAPVFISENSLESDRGQAMGLYIGSQYFGLMVGTIVGGILASLNNIVSPNFLAGTFIGFLSILVCLLFFEEASDEVQTA